MGHVRRRRLSITYMAMISVIFFFFSSRRRHTRFDCDWSSDVCSSDLLDQLERNTRDLQEAVIGVRMLPVDAVFRRFPRLRSEERRVGKECRSRWSPYH